MICKILLPLRLLDEARGLAARLRHRRDRGPAGRRVSRIEALRGGEGGPPALAAAAAAEDLGATTTGAWNLKLVSQMLAECLPNVWQILINAGRC